MFLMIHFSFLCLRVTTNLFEEIYYSIWELLPSLFLVNLYHNRDAFLLKDFFSEYTEKARRLTWEQLYDVHVEVR